MRVRGCAIVEQEDSILVMVYNYPNGRVHAIPGGNLDEGETLANCIVREFEEELGIVIELGDLLYVGDMTGSEHIKPAVHVIFRGKLISGTPKLNPDETTAADWAWLPKSQLKDTLLYPAINEALLQDHQEETPNPRYLGNCMHRKWA